MTVTFAPFSVRGYGFIVCVRASLARRSVARMSVACAFSAWA
jgi:hypothetical protein